MPTTKPIYVTLMKIKAIVKDQKNLKLKVNLENKKLARITFLLQTQKKKPKLKKTILPSTSSHSTRVSRNLCFYRFRNLCIVNKFMIIIIIIYTEGKIPPPLTHDSSTNFLQEQFFSLLMLLPRSSIFRGQSFASGTVNRRGFFPSRRPLGVGERVAKVTRNLELNP